MPSVLTLKRLCKMGSCHISRQAILGGALSKGSDWRLQVEQKQGAAGVVHPDATAYRMPPPSVGIGKSHVLTALPQPASGMIES